MMIQYIALFSLAPGHFAHRQYAFDVHIEKCDRSVTSYSVASVSLDRRNTQTVLHGFDELYDVQTVALGRGSPLALYMREFLDSALNGQYFAVDLFGSLAVPATLLPVVLESTTYSEAPAGRDYTKFGFKLRKATGRQVNTTGVVGGYSQ